LLGSAAVPESQFQSVTSNHLVRFRSTSPRKNLPPSISRKRAAANFLCSFERAFVAGHCQTIASLDIGLWSFDPGTDVIAKYFTPHQGTARNLEARNKAIESILNKIQLCKALK
jgi:hypothetical protein